MEYKQKDGIVLKGFSQVDLDLLNTNIKKQTRVFGSLGAITLAVILWVLWQVKKYKVITLLIDAIKNGC